MADDQFAQDDIYLREEAARLAREHVAELPVEDEDFTALRGRSKNWAIAEQRRQEILTLVRAGCGIEQACDKVGIAKKTYQSYRNRFPAWRARVDEARQFAQMGGKAQWDGSAGSFMATFFGQPPTWFQLLFLQELERLPPGKILLVLWPPEHGKTTTFENFANMELALRPSTRFLVASEARPIAQKILGRVMNRMDPMGPTPAYVDRFGPFLPQTGGTGLARSKWSDIAFRVYKARLSDERNFSMEAVGARGSIVSARADRLHVDDVQSTKTFTPGITDRTETWLRQDALSRPGSSGRTSICGTRVGEDDVYERLLDDVGLEDIMKVIRFPAIITDSETGEQRPLWEGKHTLDTLDMERRKYGEEAWDRNWMQNPGVSRRGKGTFTSDVVDRCKRPEHSLTHHVGHQRDIDDGDEPIVYIGLDPALGGKNCVLAAEILPEGGMIIRRIDEANGLQRNEQIMKELERVVRWCSMTARVTDVVIEDKNFQLGLVNDERLQELSDKYGFSVRGHTTGWDKYDPDIGIASMATSFRKQEILLPWADDPQTRHEIEELRRQLLAWKPGVKGNRLRQDRVMALWFIWMLWRSRWKSTENVGKGASGWQRQTLPWTMTSTGLVVPRGAA